MTTVFSSILTRGDGQEASCSVKNSTETNERGRGTPEGNRLSERTKCRGSASNWLPLGE